MDYIFDEELLEIGTEVDAFCTRCKADTPHSVVTKYEEEIRSVLCTTCNTTHAYRPPRGDAEEDIPEPIAVRKRQTTQKPSWEAAILELDTDNACLYWPRDTYQEGQVLDHPRFGLGYVADVISDNKLEAVFEDGERILVHNRSDLDIPRPKQRPGRLKQLKAKLAASRESLKSTAAKARPKGAADKVGAAQGKQGKQGKQKTTRKQPAAAEQEGGAGGPAPGETSAGATAKKPAGAASKPAGAAKKPTGAAKKPAGAASKPAGAAKKPTGAASKPAGAAKKPTGAAKKPAGTTGKAAAKGKKTPAPKTPARGATKKTTPPAKQAPGKQAPGKQAPGKQAPGKQAPGKQAPGKQAPGKQAPGKKTASSASAGGSRRAGSSAPRRKKARS